MNEHSKQAATVGGSVRFLSEEQLLAQCRIDQFRGSGPGGQKRNKTSNAVRIIHLPSGIEATGAECRSLAENRHNAIKRLRNKLVSEIREPVVPAKFEPPDWFLTIRRDTKLEVSHRHEFYCPAAGLVLDLLAVMQGNPSHVATMLGLTTTSVIKLLESESQFWTAGNRIRKELGLTPLTRRGR